MPARSMQYSFVGGEISPELGARVDVERYRSSLDLCEGYLLLPHGAAESAPGTLHIAEGKVRGSPVRLESFIFNTEQTYILEIGEKYIRFYRDLGRLEDPPGTPIEVVTPYLDADLFEIQAEQVADVLFLWHRNHPPAKLLRFSDTDWRYIPSRFKPPPVKVVDVSPAGTLTPGARTGTGITFTCSNASFLTTDIDRQIVSGVGLGVITALGASSPSATAVVTIIDDFASTAAIPQGEWFLLGSPVCEIVPDKTGPVGGLVTVTAQKFVEGGTNLISDGDFTSGAGAWTDESGTVVMTGTHTGTVSSTVLEDNTKDFRRGLVEIGHRVQNVTDGSSGRVNEIGRVTITLQVALEGGTGNNFQTNDTYEIQETGIFQVLNGEAQVHGGENGTGIGRRAITTVAGTRYRAQLDVRNAPVSVMVGSTPGGSDLLAEVTLEIGNERTIDFTATGTTSYLDVRNNQPTLAIFDNVRCQELNVDAFRTQDVGKFLQLHGGTIEITARPSLSTITGVIWKELSSDDAVIAGNWSLQEAAWSGSQGYPQALAFHQGRLLGSGSTGSPLGLAGSVVGDFENFGQGTLADDGFFFELSSNQLNAVEWLEALRDLLVGTRGGMSLVTGGQEPLKPDNVAQVPQSKFGSGSLRPLFAGDTALLVAHRGGRQMREYVLAEDTGLLRGRDILFLAQHLTVGGIRQWTFQSQPHQRVWAARNDGQLLVYTFDLSEESRGWSRRVTQGEIESVKVLPVESATETEQVWISVKRTNASGEYRSIEVMRFDEATATSKTPRLTLDAALQYDGAPATTFSGLDHLEGQTVAIVSREDVVVDGVTVQRLAYHGTQTVASGQVTTSVALRKADIGLPFRPKLRTLRPEVEARDGTIQGRKTRWHHLTVRMISSLGVRINGKDVPVRSVEDLMDAGLVSRDVDASALGGTGWTRDGRITIEQALPFPQTLLGIYGDLEWEEL